MAGGGQRSWAVMAEGSHDSRRSGQQVVREVDSQVAEPGQQMVRAANCQGSWRSLVSAAGVQGGGWPEK